GRSGRDVIGGRRTFGHDTLRIAKVNTPRIATPCIVADMVKSKAERLRAARKNAGFESATDAARAFSWTESAYRHHENGTRGFGADAAKKYGRAFKVKPGWLLGLDSVDSGPLVEAPSDESLLVNGCVEAGVWRSSDYWDDER